MRSLLIAVAATLFSLSATAAATTNSLNPQPLPPHKADASTEMRKSGGDPNTTSVTTAPAHATVKCKDGTVSTSRLAVR